jgi:3',5'-cyclic AMP phosphodiesterase CpdA
VYVVPGNHDEREALRQAFAGRGYLPASGRLDYVVELGLLRVVALDTNVPGRAGGRLGKEGLDWLDATLAQAPDRPTVIMQHHPPMPTGSPSWT